MKQDEIRAIGDVDTRALFMARQAYYKYRDSACFWDCVGVSYACNPRTLKRRVRDYALMNDLPWPIRKPSTSQKHTCVCLVDNRTLNKHLDPNSYINMATQGIVDFQKKASVAYYLKEGGETWGNIYKRYCTAYNLQRPQIQRAMKFWALKNNKPWPIRVKGSKSKTF